MSVTSPLSAAEVHYLEGLLQRMLTHMHPAEDGMDDPDEG